ncbi:MAG: CocE/NonD family hydrolase, partial [Vicinamibacterales bacterium]
VERDVAVPMRDAVVLRAVVVRPPGEGPFPTLVHRTPYGKTPTADGALVQEAVRRGYAVVVQDVRGRYASDGTFSAYLQEGRDGFDTIEWAAAQPWSTGRVGTFGLSYPGAVQWLAAVESPPHLVAMVPAMTFASPTHFWYAGGVWDGSWLYWTWLNIAPDLRRRLDVPGPRTAADAGTSWDAEGKAAQAFLPRQDLPNFKGVADWYYEWMRHGPYDPWWQWAELTTKYPRVSAAVLNVSGWHDEMYGPLGATTNFAGLVASRGGDTRSARTQLVVGPWTHGSDWAGTKIGDREMGPAAALDYTDLVLDWMDRWVREIENGVARRPPVRLYMMGAQEWRNGDRWPPRAERRDLYLAGTATAGRRAGALAWMAPESSTRSTFLSDPDAPVRDPHDGEAGGLDYRALSSDPSVVVFETPPLDDAVDVVGPIDAEIHVSVDRPDTDLWVKLLDVAPDGAAYGVMSIGLDVLRASYRNHRPERELLTPGQVYRLDLHTMMTANRFLAGHRIRVALMASFAPNMSWNLHSGALELESATAAVAHVTVHAGGRYPSHLQLPIVR